MTPSIGAVGTKLSVVIVSWNVAEHLEPCLESLARTSSGNLHLEIIVIDNGSSDGTLELMREKFPGATVIPLGRNIGFPAATNMGLRHATGEQILILNPDTRVSPGCLQACSQALIDHPEVGLLGCKLLGPDGSVQYECALNQPSLLDTPIEAFYLHMLFPKSRMFGRLRMSYWDRANSRFVDRISGAFMMLRRDVLEELGPLDEQFFMYYEDLEFCARARRHGWRILYLASAATVHLGGRSRAKTDAPLDDLAPRIRYTFFREYRGRFTAWAFRFLYGIQSLVRVCIAGCCQAMLPRRSPLRGRPVARPAIHLERLKWSIGLGTSEIRQVGAREGARGES